MTPASEIFSKYIREYKKLKGNQRKKRIMDDLKNYWITEVK